MDVSLLIVFGILSLHNNVMVIGRELSGGGREELGSSRDGFDTGRFLRNLLRFQRGQQSAPSTPPEGPSDEPLLPEEVEGIRPFPPPTLINRPVPEEMEKRPPIAAASSMSNGQGRSHSAINLNIIVVPVLHEMVSSETENVGKKKSLQIDDMLAKNRLGFPATADTEEDLETQASSSFLSSRMESQTPAPGIIGPTPPSCRLDQVYDRSLGQCISRRSGSCPLCIRRRG